MTGVPWSLHLLSELLSGFSLEDPEALPKVINRVAEAVDAEVVALLGPRALRYGIGLAEHDRERLVTQVPVRPERLSVGAGCLHLHWAPMEAEELLVAGRLGEPFDLEERSLLRAMARTIQLSLKLLAAVAAERTAREAAVRQANRDAMTDLPSRANVLDHLERLLAAPVGGNRSVATVLFIDIDRFKQINDVHGHAAGDQFLISVAEVLRTVVREGDLVGRLSGDEFVVLTHCEAAAEASALAERIIAAIEQPMHLAGRGLRHSASVGIAFAEPGDDAERLIENADLAMYAAKDRGRGRFICYDGELRQRALERAAVEAELRRALSEGEMVPHFQPIIHQRERRVLGFEALARWQHPERGVLAPAAFLAVAQETGQIIEIDRQILASACRAVARWQALAPEGGLTVSVNVSGLTLADPSLVPWVVRVLAESGLEASQLSLEITETMLVDDQVATTETLSRLRALGIQLIIDDFGTGYSSLLYLKRFPVGMLKIDRSFIDGLGRDRDDEVIVEAVVRVSQALGIELIAEGVETVHQAEWLRALGCDRLQGYLFSPAREAEVVRAMLAQKGCAAWASSLGSPAIGSG